eukprot:GABV01000702.1.p2 GENE.GABV01000702.1~~GABV01000702.1.p2  ORF type:complete len:200 (+),score=85.55 GABV01000702.1:544-1143(+)
MAFASIAFWSFDGDFLLPEYAENQQIRRAFEDKTVQTALQVFPCSPEYFRDRMLHSFGVVQQSFVELDAPFEDEKRDQESKQTHNNPSLNRQARRPPSKRSAFPSTQADRPPPLETFIPQLWQSFELNEVKEAWHDLALLPLEGSPSRLLRVEWHSFVFDRAVLEDPTHVNSKANLILLECLEAIRWPLMDNAVFGHKM